MRVPSMPVVAAAWQQQIEARVRASGCLFARAPASHRRSPL